MKVRNMKLTKNSGGLTKTVSFSPFGMKSGSFGLSNKSLKLFFTFAIVKISFAKNENIITQVINTC